MIITFDDVREYINVQKKFDDFDRARHHDWLARNLYWLVKLAVAAEHYK